MAALGLCCCTWAFSSCRKQGLHTSLGTWAFPLLWLLLLSLANFFLPSYWIMLASQILHIFVLMCAQSLNCVWLLVTLWTVALQAPLSVGSFRQEYWCGLPCLPPRDLPTQGLNLSLISCIVGIFFNAEPSGNPFLYYYWLYIDISGLLWFSSYFLEVRSLITPICWASSPGQPLSRPVLTDTVAIQHMSKAIQLWTRALQMWLVQTKMTLSVTYTSDVKDLPWKKVKYFNIWSTCWKADTLDILG